AAIVLAAAATPPALDLLAAGAAALALKPYRTWTAAQLYLMAAAIRNIRSKELVWEKQVK
ncbi:MAG: glycosyltransferase family 2 protein, partial [Pyrobaculum sp.]